MFQPPFFEKGNKKWLPVRAQFLLNSRIQFKELFQWENNSDFIFFPPKVTLKLEKEN